MEKSSHWQKKNDFTNNLFFKLNIVSKTISNVYHSASKL